jgi:succinate-semialdehyde dehydrogenase/glutarate-semialdehyde dehydrogenase
MAEKMTQEMGKLLKEATGEVDKCVASCKFIREHFEQWKSERESDLHNGFSVHLQPLGPLVGIMPWNFPLWQVVRFAVPAILCGNTILLKHAPSTWGVAELIEDLFRQSLPDSVYLNLQVDVDAIEPLIADRRVQGVSLTGSVRAGRSVGRAAGEHLKKCVLELGGSDAYVILEDADVETAAKTCATSRLINAGQSCVSAKRFIVTKKNAAAFTEVFRAELAKANWGDPMKASTTLAPLARKDLRDGLADQVQRSIKAGAKVALGGSAPKQPGFFYEATVLTDVQPGQPAFDEELFGPVGAVITATDDKQAMALANRSPYGLGGAVFSRDVEKAKRLAIQELECGMAFVNDFVKSDAQVPFGGIKDSGVGRELGREGCFEFSNVKTVFAKA